ncbi:MAG: hypothetical protein JO031_09955 [Ktedonobacteraceae bacterium]|nr:hypothetical protein [Ktedonobacteraceae bacterium]
MQNWLASRWNLVQLKIIPNFNPVGEHILATALLASRITNSGRREAASDRSLPAITR